MSTWNQKRSRVVDQFLTSISNSNSSDIINNPHSTSSTANLDPKSLATRSPSHALMLMTNQGAVGEQLLETVRLTIKDLVRDLLGIPSLPGFFRNFEEKFAAGENSVDANDVLEATTGSQGTKQQQNNNSSSNTAAANMLFGGDPAEAVAKKEAAENNNNNYNSNNNDASDDTGKLFAGIRAIALVPKLRRHVDAICIACVDRLFNLVGPEVSMVATLQDKIGSLHTEITHWKKTLTSREELALQQRSELLRELTAAYEQEQAAEYRFDNLLEKCKLLAAHQGKSGITELFRPLPPPKQKVNSNLNVPVEPVHPQTGTPVIGAKVKQLTDKLEAQWELLDEVDRVKASAKEESREASLKIRDVKERLAREKEITHLAKKSEEVLKEEVNRLQAKLRQADLMLRAKEHDVELAIMREREVAASAGRDSKIQQLLYRQQEQEARIKRAMMAERLKMEVADFESQMSALTEQYTQQAAVASSHIRKLETDLEKTKKELREAKMNAGEGKLDAHARSGSSAKTGGAGSSGKDKDGKKKSGERVSARIPSSQRLQTEQMQSMIQQLNDQLRSERAHNDRVLQDKDKKIRDRDVEILSLRENMSKASNIQMALQGELEALSASMKISGGSGNINNDNNNNNNTGSPRGRSASVVSTGSRRKSAANPFYDENKSYFSDDDEKDDDTSKNNNTNSTTNNNGKQLFNNTNNDNDNNKNSRTEEDQEKIDELEDILQHVQTERATLAADLEEANRKKNEFEREFETAKAQIEMARAVADRTDEIHQEEMKNLNSEMEVLKNQILAKEAELLEVQADMGHLQEENEVAKASEKNEDGTPKTAGTGTSSTSTTNTKTRVVQNTKRSPLDIAEIERLRKDNGFLKSKIDQLDKELNTLARKNFNAAQLSSNKHRDFAHQVTPLDILEGNKNYEHAVSGRHRPVGATITSTSYGRNNNNKDENGGNSDDKNSELHNIIGSNSSSRNTTPSHHHHRGSGNRRHVNNSSSNSKRPYVVDQPPPSSAVGGASGSSTRKVVTFSDGNNNNNQIGDDENNNNSQHQRGISPSNDSDTNNSQNRNRSPSHTKKLSDFSDSYVSPYRITPKKDDPKHQRDPTNQDRSLSDSNNPSSRNFHYKPGNSSNRAAQLRYEMSQRFHSHKTNTNREADQQRAEDEELAALAEELDERKRQQDEAAAEEEQRFGIKGQLKSGIETINKNGALVIVDGENQTVKMGSRRGGPAWIDMTELVLKAQKYMHPTTTSSSSSSAHQQQQYHQGAPTAGTSSIVTDNFYRKHNQHPFSVHANRCHDLRLGCEDVSCQTDDVIVVEPSSHVSLLEMMKPLSVSQQELENGPARNDGFRLGKDGYAVATPYNNSNSSSDRPPSAASSSTTNKPTVRGEELVALLVKLSDLTGFSNAALVSSIASSNKNNSSSSTNSVVHQHHHIQQYSTPSGETVQHYPGNQGAVVAKLQVPPLKFSIASSNLQGSGDLFNVLSGNTNNRKSSNNSRPTSATSTIPNRPTSAKNNRPQSALSNTSTEVAHQQNNNNTNQQQQMIYNDDEDDQDTIINDDLVVDAEDKKFAHVGKSILVPHSFGTAQLTGDAVSNQLQDLLKKAITQWREDNLMKSAAKSSNIGGNHSTISGRRTPLGAANHKNKSQPLKNVPRRPNSAMSGTARNFLATSETASGGGANLGTSGRQSSNGRILATSGFSAADFNSLRPRDGLYIPRNPVNEGIELGASRKPHYRHPVPNEHQLRYDRNVPIPMGHVKDEADRKYEMSDTQRVPHPTWFETMDGEK